MPRLVEGGSGQHQAEHHQEQLRLVDRRAGALPDAVDEEEPDVERHECGEHSDDDPGREERCEQSGDGVDHALRDDTGSHPQREEGIAGRNLRVGTVGRGGQPGAAQLAVDDALDVRRVEAGVGALARCGRDLVEVAFTVHRLGDGEDDRVQLDDRPVRTPREMRRVLVTRAGVLPQQRHAVDQARPGQRWAVHGAGRTGHGALPGEG